MKDPSTCRMLLCALESLEPESRGRESWSLRATSAGTGNGGRCKAKRCFQHSLHHTSREKVSLFYRLHLSRVESHDCLMSTSLWNGPSSICQDFISSDRIHLHAISTHSSLPPRYRVDNPVDIAHAAFKTHVEKSTMYTQPVSWGTQRFTQSHQGFPDSHGLRVVNWNLSCEISRSPECLEITSEKRRHFYLIGWLLWMIV